MLFSLLTSLNRAQKSWVFLALDLIWVSLAFVLAQYLTNTSRVPSPEFWHNAWYLLVLLPVSATLIGLLGLHRVKLNAYGIHDAITTAGMALVLGVVGVVLGSIPGFAPALAPKVLAVMSLLFLVLSVSSRIAALNLVLYVLRRKQIRKRVMIYGAGQTGQQLAAALKTDDTFEAACFLDDNAALQKTRINGLRVYAPLHVHTLVERLYIDRIVLAMPSTSRAVRVRIAHELEGVGCEVRTLPSFAEMVLSSNEAHVATPVKTSALLGRTALEDILPSSTDVYEGKNLLVTGAGGSIGAELCRQLLHLKPARLVLLDHSELALYTVMQEISETTGFTELKAVLGSINDMELVIDVLTSNDVDIVFHAAAYKHLPLVETNALEGLRNNILGTRTVAEAARQAAVDRFVLVSSDKAVRPTSIMGASKRMAELVVQDLATRSDHTRFAMVRFGNVLGSSGSVIPLFQDQIRHGGPLTVTHPDVTRYFMTVTEAVSLMLLAGTFARGGDVFVLDMGQPVRIVDIARKLVEGAGYSLRDENTPDGDIAITFTGLRPGEKMHEELLIGSDMLTTPHPKILRAQENTLSEIEIANALQDLRRAIETRDVDTAISTLSKWVEDYRSGDIDTNVVA